MANYQIGVIVGSIRKEAWSLKLANALIALAPESLNLKIIEIGHLSLFNQDYEMTPPEPWVEFKKQISALDGVLFVTPEHNRSIPSALKNALDIASRPYGHNAWHGKPGAVVSNSPGGPGAFGANHHLRQCFVFLNILCMQQPEAYIGHIANLFDDNNNINNQGTKDFLSQFMSAFAAWIETHVKQ
ncbi:chromate reductase, Class I, flavoprotein [Legionella beliardensis]|uniref:Chromate reductase, Class I, flavoprotein n=1 Tax=Legionella beliardensis TaxID=91822 RepID=A0A378IAY9_9GAMM|nr:NAD(P)H-dependent oxidoreductase [Legionella beliardensis]STX29484.1 chromate reductase, Class I, flavoprotein [Legionella beliardensis]